jgi:hypothetical protein
MDWSKGTWAPGDEVRYHQGHGHAEQFYSVHAGLYWYAGMGCGRFFRPDGTHVWCAPSEAAEEARRLGVSFTYVDSFIVSSFKSVMG